MFFALGVLIALIFLSVLGAYGRWMDGRLSKKVIEAFERTYPEACGECEYVRYLQRSGRPNARLPQPHLCREVHHRTVQ